MSFETDGYRVYSPQGSVADWAALAHRHAMRSADDPAQRTAWLRHQGTWFVGVDALPNGPDGALDDLPFNGPWTADVPDLTLHKGQVSVVWPGYPLQDANESEAAHRYRIKRFGAHVDGIHGVGADKRRFVLEPHAYVLGVPLNDSKASPLMVWPGSHQIMREAFVAAAPITTDTDVTEVYQNARRRVFDQIDPVPIHAAVGQAVLLHRHVLHGIAPWDEGTGHRAIAYFRPEFDSHDDWVHAP